MKILHTGDIHFCEKHLDEANRCMQFIVERAQQERPALNIIAGDLFDHRLDQNSLALLSAIRHASALGCIAPTLILQGTFSHDAPGALDVFRHVMSDYPIYVASRIHQVAFYREGGVFRASDGWAFEDGVPTADLLISCLPSINKGAVAAAVGAENAAEALGDHVASLLRAWAPLHQQARSAGAPAIIVTHGTVSESVTEHGVPCAGLDHEYSTGALFASEASAVMLNHIHKHQWWDRGGRKIAYAGSPGRLHYGEIDPKGFLLWDVQPEGASFEFIETPAKRLVEVTFDGLPDMAELAKVTADAAGAHVRIRYAVDAEHRHAVDKAAITALFADAAAVKIEPTINPIQRQRAAGIGQALTVADKLGRWCELTETAPAPLLERLAALESQNAEEIVEGI